MSKSFIEKVSNKVTDEDIVSRLKIAKKIACSPILNKDAKVALIKEYAGFDEKELNTESLADCCDKKSEID
jgi:hypothetical protein